MKFTATRTQEHLPNFALIAYFVLPTVFPGIWLAQTTSPIFLKLDSLPIFITKTIQINP